MEETLFSPLLLKLEVLLKMTSSQSVNCLNSSIFACQSIKNRVIRVDLGHSMQITYL